MLMASLNPDGSVMAATRTIAPVSKVTEPHAPNAVCTAAQADDIAQNSAMAGLVVCRAGLWTPVGTRIASEGGACATNDALAETVTGESLICVNNKWKTTTSRMGKWAVSGTVLAVHGDVVAKPACGSGGTPLIIAVPQGIDAGNLFTNFKTQDNGPDWTVFFVDGDGAATSSSAIAQVGCWYS